MRIKQILLESFHFSFMCTGLIISFILYQSFMTLVEHVLSKMFQNPFVSSLQKV